MDRHTTVSGRSGVRDESSVGVAAPARYFGAVELPLVFDDCSSRFSEPQLDGASNNKRLMWPQLDGASVAGRLLTPNLDGAFVAGRALTPPTRWRVFR